MVVTDCTRFICTYIKRHTVELEAFPVPLCQWSASTVQYAVERELCVDALGTATGVEPAPRVEGE